MNSRRDDALLSEGIGRLALARLYTSGLPYALKVRGKGRPVMDEIQIVTVFRFLAKREFGKQAADATTIIRILTDLLIERRTGLDALPEDIETTLDAYIKKYRLTSEAYDDTMRAIHFVRSEDFDRCEAEVAKLWIG